MNQKAFWVTKYSRSKIRIVITCLFVRHSLRPGVHIITLDGEWGRRVDAEENAVEKEQRTALALIDNCDKNVADEK